VRWFKRALLRRAMNPMPFPISILVEYTKCASARLRQVKHYGLALAQQADFAQATTALRRFAGKVELDKMIRT